MLGWDIFCGWGGGAVFLHPVTQNLSTGGTIFLSKLPYSPCLTTHWSGWTEHTGEWLIFLATAQFEAVRQNKIQPQESKS
jgi:hypothetical protein